jgi:pilus assembly protein CpaE
MKSDSINGVEHLASFPAEHNRIGLVVAGSDAHQRDQVCKALRSITELRLEIHNQGGTEGESDKARSDRILLLILGDDERLWDQEIAPWKEGNQSSVVAILPTRSAEAARIALRSGADEVIFLPLDGKELFPILVKLSERQGARISRRGFTLSFVGIGGGAGSSSLVVAVAFALRRLTGKQIALVDLGLQTSALAALLDLEPEHCITELADPTSKIDSMRLESVLCTHESGLRLLAAPNRIEEGELVSSSSIATTIGVLRELFDCVIVDCGHHVSESSVAAWEHSDRLFYVLNQSITSICPARRFCELFDRLQLKWPRLELLLNRYSVSSPISIEKIETALHRPISTCIARDDKAFGSAELAAADLAAAAAGSDATTEIDKLACSLLGQAPNGEVVRHGVLNRLFSALRP